MTLQVRRIVTGHDANGKAVVATDERLTAVSRRIGANITGCEIWSTDRMPVDNSREADAAQRAGFIVRHRVAAVAQHLLLADVAQILTAEGRGSPEGVRTSSGTAAARARQE